jgi:hypothetical protein
VEIQQPFAKEVKEIHSMIDLMIALHPKSASQFGKRIWHMSEIRNKQKAIQGMDIGKSKFWMHHCHGHR